MNGYSRYAFCTSEETAVSARITHAQSLSLALNNNLALLDLIHPAHASNDTLCTMKQHIGSLTTTINDYLQGDLAEDKYETSKWSSLRELVIHRRALKQDGAISTAQSFTLSKLEHIAFAGSLYDYTLQAIFNSPRTSDGGIKDDTMTIATFDRVEHFIFMEDFFEYDSEDHLIMNDNVNMAAYSNAQATIAALYKSMVQQQAQTGLISSDRMAYLLQPLNYAAADNNLAPVPAALSVATPVGGILHPMPTVVHAIAASTLLRADRSVDQNCACVIS